jgi:regulator of protease activity HflC (stomatin/prohibitin superfamily)
MAVDPSAVPAPVVPVEAAGAYLAAGPSPQLTQARAPLDEAGAAFATPDSAGHFPIVVLPDRARRTRIDFILGGMVAIVVAILLDVGLGLKILIVAGSVLAIVAGLFRAFIVPVPMGAQAVLLRAGKFHKTVGPGTHFVLPFVPVSHIVALREVPFGAPAIAIPTRDDVRTNIDMVMTFTIEKPENFVFTITAPDFDEVCQATCQQSLRLLVREKTAAEVIDMSDADTDQLRTAIAEVLGRYGIKITRVVITHVSLPLDFVRSREAQGLAAIQRAEEQEQHALEMLRQADLDERARRRIAAQREAIELEAANEVARLERLEQRLREYPAALEWDVQTQRLDVARALAANTRAMVQVGPADDIATAMLMHTAMDDGVPAASERERPRGRQARAADGSQGRPEGSAGR